jgi:hypothetical protein
LAKFPVFSEGDLMMRKSGIKAAAIVLLAGTMFQFAGCLNRVLIEASYQVFADLVAGFLPDLTGGA